MAAPMSCSHPASGPSLRAGLTAERGSAGSCDGSSDRTVGFEGDPLRRQGRRWVGSLPAAGHEMSVCLLTSFNTGLCYPCMHREGPSSSLQDCKPRFHVAYAVSDTPCALQARLVKFPVKEGGNRVSVALKQHGVSTISRQQRIEFAFHEKRTGAGKLPFDAVNWPLSLRPGASTLDSLIDDSSPVREARLKFWCFAQKSMPNLSKITTVECDEYTACMLYPNSH